MYEFHLVCDDGQVQVCKEKEKNYLYSVYLTWYEYEQRTINQNKGNTQTKRYVFDICGGPHPSSPYP